MLVVDDEGAIRSLICRALELAEGYEVVEADGGRAAQLLLHGQSFDVVVTDLQMPEFGGLRLMQWAQQAGIDTSWIILTGHGTFDAAVRAVQLGAFDFLTKPLPVIDALVVSVRNCVRQRRLAQQRDYLHGQIQQNNVRLRKQVHQLRQAVRLLLAQAETIGEDLRRAELIQRAMLPAAAPDLNGYTVNAIYRPSRQVGGDLYDVARLDDRHIAIYVADAAGHGVSAAMLAVLFKHRLPVMHGQPPEPTAPAEVLAAVNDCLLSEFSRPGLFVTAAYCLLDTHTGEMVVASAGHPALVLRHADGSSERISRTGPALGLDEQAHIGQQTYTLGRGDRLLLYTDGLYEDDTASPSSDHSVDELLAEDRPGREILDSLLTGAAAQRGGKPATDDITLMLLTAAPGQSTIDNGPSIAELTAAQEQSFEASQPAAAQGGQRAPEPAGAESPSAAVTVAVSADPSEQTDQSVPTSPEPLDAAAAGNSIEEASPPRPQRGAEGKGQAQPSQPGVGVGVTGGGGCTICIRGRGTWTSCSALHDVGFSQVDAHHPLTLDFSNCQYLDSTFLGTVQEMVEHADRQDVEVHLQGVSPQLRAQFDELGMDRVLHHITDQRTPLPERIDPLTAALVGDDHQRRRILYAHEALAALNEHNRREFLQLIESMRGELARSSGT